MCSSKRNRGIYAFGVISTMVFVVCTVLALMMIVKVNAKYSDSLTKPVRLSDNWLQHLHRDTINVIFGLITGFAVLGMILSVLFILGIKNNRPNYVLAYFAYGTLLTIVLFIMSLLKLIVYRAAWRPALFVASLSFLYARIVAYIYCVYQEMLQKESSDDMDATLLEA